MGANSKINCKHMFYPYVDGVSTNNEIQFDEKEVEKAYKLSQQQRRLEVKVRDAKRALQLAETTGDEKEIAHQKMMVKRRQSASKQFSDANGLKRRYDREQIIK